MNFKHQRIFGKLICGVALVCMAGCSHHIGAPGPSSSTPEGSIVQVSAAQPTTFNPAVAPPPQQVQGYVFNSSPAPVPTITAVVKHHRHRYLHIVLRDHHCYLEDDYGHYYQTGRDDSGNVYPIYRDPSTGADYPLYYDSQRDEYYRCVDDDGTYYRNYVGDPDDEFYKGNPDQEEECASDQCQPFVVNYGEDYNDYSGYDPEYARYNGPHYSRHNHDFESVLPVIVAAFIILESDNNGGRGYGGGGHGYGQTIVVNHHNYRRATVIVNHSSNGGGRGGVQYAALPGPPIGHFHGYRQPRKAGGNRNAGRNVSVAAATGGGNHSQAEQHGPGRSVTGRPASRPVMGHNGSQAPMTRAVASQRTHGLHKAGSRSIAQHPARGQQTGRQVMAKNLGAHAVPFGSKATGPTHHMQRPANQAGAHNIAATNAKRGKMAGHPQGVKQARNVAARKPTAVPTRSTRSAMRRPSHPLLPRHAIGPERVRKSKPQAAVRQYRQAVRTHSVQPSARPQPVRRAQQSKPVQQQRRAAPLRQTQAPRAQPQRHSAPRPQPQRQQTPRPQRRQQTSRPQPQRRSAPRPQPQHGVGGGGHQNDHHH